jgi:hypothetical protein
MDLAQLVQDVLDGNESGLMALAALREEKKYIENCINQIEEIAQEEAAQYAEKAFIFKDLMIEKRAGARVFSFKLIPEWTAAKESLKSVEDKYKAAYKNYEAGNLTADKNGEELALPEVTYRKDSIIIKRIEL